MFPQRYTRVRSDDTRKHTTLDYVERSGEGQPSVGGRFTLPNMAGGTVQMYDCTTNYAKRRSHGDVVINPMHIGEVSRTSTPGAISYSNTEYACSWRGDFPALAEANLPALTWPLADDIDSMCQRALVKAYAKMNSSEFMAGEQLATLMQTVAMLRFPFKSSLKLLRSMKRRRRAAFKRSKAMTLTRANAQAWLEKRYGWQPVVMDIETAVELAVKQHSKLNRRFVARAQESQESVRTETFAASPLAGPDGKPVWEGIGAWDATGKTVLQHKLRAAAGVIYEVKPRTTPQTMAAIMGTRVRDIPATLWELTPLSFVGDWFFNVGDWLQAVMPDPFITPLGNWVTYVDRRSAKIDGTVHYYWPTDPPKDVTGVLGTSERIWNSVERRPNQSLTYTPVWIDEDLSTLHTVDAMALMCGKIHRALMSFKH